MSQYCAKWVSRWFSALFPLMIGTAYTLVPAPTWAAVLGQNLLTNGNADAGGCDGVGDAIGDTIPSIPGWTSTGSFSVLCYGATGFEFVNLRGETVLVRGLPDATSPGPVDRGAGLFFGGGDRTPSSASQRIDVTDLAAVIDASRASFALSGWLGGYTTDEDSPSLNLSFLDGSDQLLGSITLGGPTAAERNSITGLLLKATEGVLPTGTRQVMVQLEMNYTRGRVNDAYADDLSLMVSKVPDPSLGILSLSTIAGLTVWQSRRRPQVS